MWDYRCFELSCFCSGTEILGRSSFDAFVKRSADIHRPSEFVDDTSIRSIRLFVMKKRDPSSQGRKQRNKRQRRYKRKQLMAEFGDLLAEPMGHSLLVGRVVLIGDCVETSGTFVLHLLKRCPSLDSSSVVFVALSHPFSHYDRVLRKMGCNLSVQGKNEKLHFLELPDFSAGSKGNSIDHGFCELYKEIWKAVEGARLKETKAGCVYIMIDDLSLLEIVANGSENDVLNFLHYCATFTSEMDCLLIILNHEDVYSSEAGPGLLMHLQHPSDIEIRTASLSNGLAVDLHGQISTYMIAFLSQKKKYDCISTVFFLILVQHDKLYKFGFG